MDTNVEAFVQWGAAPPIHVFLLPRSLPSSSAFFLLLPLVKFLHYYLTLLVVLASAPPFFTSWQRCSPPLLSSRRGYPEQQQQPLLAVKVELDEYSAFVLFSNGYSLIFLTVLGLSLSVILVAATSTFQDFCVADPQEKVLVNGLACKDPKLVEANDIFFSGLHIAGNTANPVGSKMTPVFASLSILLWLSVFKLHLFEMYRTCLLYTSQETPRTLLGLK
ncbi:RmlC-like jelly roll fold [Vigna unguiculata]|uniref:RmlC-like jelly roll fold n=1 Tax=Vigna unguiculata TaxID=3917 RepID=A0A4D6L119_VIGUN|nr:RmlC-like jelly roll fold [Vigna unguiculata]